MNFEGVDPNNKNTVSLKKFSTSGYVGSDPIYYTERIILENIILKPDELDLIMKGSNGDSQIDMKNSEIDVSIGKLMLNPGDNFVLNSFQNSNKISKWDYDIANNFSIYIAPSSDLTFSNPTLDFNGRTLINVNTGKLTIEGDSSNFLVKNPNSGIYLTSGELLVKDTGTTVELQNLKSDLSKI